ncbi:MAG: 50S ribosomal protein L6 [Pseudomonadota bacterium]
MSRVANAPVAIPKGVEVNLSGQAVKVKGGKGAMEFTVHDDVSVAEEGGQLTFAAKAKSQQAVALAGTTRALVNNMVHGVSEGFERKLLLQGVGYRAQAQGKKLTMQLGFSHPIEYTMPDGVDVATPSQTEIVVTGVDKQRIGQVCAELRAFRPPEPYKGKGVRYADEYVRRKESKKKK